MSAYSQLLGASWASLELLTILGYCRVDEGLTRGWKGGVGREVNEIGERTRGQSGLQKPRDGKG